MATFAWNTARHLELYFAAPCTGRVLHTLNIRLFAEQLTYIANHAEDEVIFVDSSLIALLWPLLGTMTTVRHVVVMDDGKGEVPDDAPGGIEVHDYEALLAAARARRVRRRPTRTAPRRCVTRRARPATRRASSTRTGRRACTRSVCMTADSLGACERDVILPVVPMFHANAWGLAHAAVATGAKLVMPGPDLSAPTLARLIEEEQVTVAAGVPTIWMGVLPELAGRDTSNIRAIPCGGSAGAAGRCPRASAR